MYISVSMHISMQMAFVFFFSFCTFCIKYTPQTCCCSNKDKQLHVLRQYCKLTFLQDRNSLRFPLFSLGNYWVTQKNNAPLTVDMNIQIGASCEIYSLPESLKTRGSLVRRNTKGSPNLEVCTWSYPVQKATSYPEQLKSLNCQWQS